MAEMLTLEASDCDESSLPTGIAHHGVMLAGVAGPANVLGSRIVIQAKRAKSALFNVSSRVIPWVCIAATSLRVVRDTAMTSVSYDQGFPFNEQRREVWHETETIASRDRLELDTQ